MESERSIGPVEPGEGRLGAYGLGVDPLGKGVTGGRIISGYLQGQEAAELALKILNGYRVGNLKLLKDSPTQYMFDYRYLKKFGVPLSSVPAGSHVINEPPAAYEQYKSLLIGITVTSFFIAMIMLWRFKIQQTLLKSEHKHALELEKKVSERTRELQVANLELQRISNMDGLTQLYNRRYFDKSLASELKRLQRSSSPISLLICDIDYFKDFNDSYGHLAGDDCIRMVVESIRKFCNRVSDIPARFGGEEFAIILPDTESEGAMAIAEHIRKDIESKSIPHESSRIKDIVSISIGVTTITPGIHSLPKSVILLADQALYESKHNGRDRVTLKIE